MYRMESLWKLVYFLKNGSLLVDSRITEHLNVSKLPVIKGPRGQYKLLRGNALTNLLQHSYSKSIYLSSKLDTAGKKRLQTIILEAVKKENKGNIQVDIRQQEEYLLRTGKRAWRIVYFIKINGDYIPAYSLKELDHSNLAISLNFTGPQSQNYTIVNNTSIYRYRHAFFLHFDSKVATKSFSVIKKKIIAAWKTMKRDCNCLSVETVGQGSLEEVLDTEGKYYWRLTYFMKRNDSIVESMTHIPLNISHMNEHLKTVTNAKGKQYRTLDVSNKLLIRSRLAFKLNLNLHIGYKDKVKFQQSIKETWIKMKPGTYNIVSHDGCFT
ncbi:hypothetical protein KUTeg_016024 [Tegillarca granosa]|uniref:Uncharacterized protein n=1 Tax=Tegillarca granosa TaxID=220873 RepID=A0ABQ9EJN2_TEGGR|nr:hypothetical protein KUTeg_016024 [Tegillarca granosa]